ncbi:neuronal acetylcholine receptor subunit beta-3-like [Mya arenaria]|uniref:neuronal acetylcholine receptor subunit beta-3-like n=1 Tax=Mya arenaria TaxID=6604 RepID=UPI0022E4A44A|nr:neuronal acetylcholine receptor subunit beta-3-like [Mya arenaria]
MLITGGNCANVTHVGNLYEHIFNNYNRKLLPLVDYSDTVNIQMSVSIISLNNFDEMSGELDLTMMFFATWEETRISWTSADYGGATSLLVAPEDLWRPQLFLVQSFGSLQDVGNNSIMPRVYANGTVFWKPGMVIKVSCTVDVTYFPFDTQTCALTLSGWSYDAEEVLLQANRNELDRTHYSDNTQWDLYQTNVTSLIYGNEIPSALLIMLKLKRRDQFYVIYIIIPLVVLGLINHIVFAMPVASGERMSVAITTFLSFIVYLGMINENVPPSSSPMAYLYFYVMFLLVYSSMTMFLCLLSMIIHDKQGPVPETLKTIVIYLRFWCCRKSRRTDIRLRKVSPDEHNANVKSIPVFSETESLPDVMSTATDNVPAVTWTVVGDTYDRWVSIALSMIFIIITVVIFVRLFLNTGL